MYLYMAYALAYYTEHVVCLPVPEKAQAQYNFCIFPLNGDGTNPVSSDGAAASEQQILWTAPNTVVKSTQVSGEITVESEDTYKSLLLRVLNGCLGHFGKQVVVPNEKEFASQTNQAHRKGDKAVHVKAFRGSKDGEFVFHVMDASSKLPLHSFDPMTLCVRTHRIHGSSGWQLC